ncbi:hypothetical protein Mnod_6414 [Methylobacterium nodulans ORS 2060]|uniref:Uncharacterized protein n=1 Tax=Methylobacterium nodulans (strain LMG 21967 / CNCM I-2342 / ORS 2060) TaxID=460265 RepID=B8IC14_METNO|nr:hypothetical protein Mnod_6414 [Methylobacterium nodulans ORS 2060]
MADTPTVGELYKLKHVTDEQIDAVVRDDLNDPTPGMRLIAEGIALDFAAVVLAHPYAREVLARENAPEAQQRIAVRTAIRLARPARVVAATTLWPRPPQHPTAQITVSWSLGARWPAFAHAGCFLQASGVENAAGGASNRFTAALA